MHSLGAPQRPVRVLHILEATDGGTRRWLEETIVGLDPLRVQQGVVCSLGRAADFSGTVARFRQGKIPVWVLNMHRRLAPLEDAAAVRQLRAILDFFPCDLIHAHSTKAGFLARLAAFPGKSSRLIYSPHAFAFLCGGCRGKVLRGLEWLARPLTGRVMAVSESERHLALTLGYEAAQVCVLSNGVQKAPVRSLPPCGLPIVGTVAQLRPQKDLETFLRACALLQRLGQQFRAEICGAGKLMRPLEQRARELGVEHRMTFLGHVAAPREAMQRWSVYACTSRYEGMSFALLDAMACALPIVATRAPGVEEVLVHQQTGLLTPPGDALALGEAIALLLRNPELAQRYGCAAAERAGEHYYQERQLKRLAKYYEAAVYGEIPA